MAEHVAGLVGALRVVNSMAAHPRRPGGGAEVGLHHIDPQAAARCGTADLTGHFDLSFSGGRLQQPQHRARHPPQNLQTNYRSGGDPNEEHRGTYRNPRGEGGGVNLVHFVKIAQHHVCAARWQSVNSEQRRSREQISHFKTTSTQTSSAQPSGPSLQMTRISDCASS